MSCPVPVWVTTTPVTLTGTLTTSQLKVTPLTGGSPPNVAAKVSTGKGAEPPQIVIDEGELITGLSNKNTLVETGAPAQPEALDSVTDTLG